MKILNIWGRLPNVFVKTLENGDNKYRMYKLIYRYSDNYEITKYWNNSKILIDRVKEYCGLKG